MTRNINVLVVLLTLVFGVTACSPSGRFKEDDEPELMGDRKAGSVVFDRLAELTTELLNDRRAQAGPAGFKKIAFVGIQNLGAEELGDHRESLYATINSRIVNSEVFRPIAREYVEAALRETGLRVEDLFLARGHSQFMSVLREGGNTPDFLIFGQVTTGTTVDGDTRQRNYQLTLKLVDAESGEELLNKIDRVQVIYENQ